MNSYLRNCHKLQVTLRKPQFIEDFTYNIGGRNLSKLNKTLFELPFLIHIQWNMFKTANLFSISEHPWNEYENTKGEMWKRVFFKNMFSVKIKLDCALYQFLIFNCLYNCFCHLDGWSLVQIPEKVNNSFLLAGQVF